MPYLLAILGILSMLINPVVTIVISILMWLVSIIIPWRHREQPVLKYQLAPVCLAALLLEQWAFYPVVRPLWHTLLIDLAILGVGSFAIWMLYQTRHDPKH
jgi:hypothetical protein